MTSRENVRELATGIVAIVAPEDSFIVEDNFEGLADDWDTAVAQDEGRFIGGAEVATFAAAVVPFLLSFLGAVAKDVAKDQAKKAASALLDKLLHKKASQSEEATLRADIETAIAKSKVSREQKQVLNEGFDLLFTKLAAPD